MTRDEFKKEYGFTPLHLFQYARAAKQIEDDDALVGAAEDLLEAREAFRKELEKVDIKEGEFQDG